MRNGTHVSCSSLCAELNPAVIFQTIFFSFSFDMDNYLQNHWNIIAHFHLTKHCLVIACRGYSYLRITIMGSICGTWPHTSRCSFTTSCAATDASRCTCLSTDITMATDALRCTLWCDLSMATDTLGRPAPLWTHPQVTVPSAWLHTALPASPAQQHRHSSAALAICQPRNIKIAVIKMFPGSPQ